MSRMTRLLERVYHRSIVTPIIVETSRVEDIYFEVKDLIPMEIREHRVRELILFTYRLEGVELLDKFFGGINIIKRFNMISFPATWNIIEDLADDSRVEKIYLDRFMWISRFPTVPSNEVFYDPHTGRRFVSVSSIRRLFGIEDKYTGRGVKLFILDTGGTRIHRMTSHMRMYTAIPGVYTDTNGHGEHVASIAAGKRGFDGLLKVEVSGIAPNAELTSVKCLATPLGFGRESSIIKALEIAYEKGADIVNMSLGSDPGHVSHPSEDPESKPIKMLTEAGCIVCAAAGNSGMDGVGSPGSIPESLTVGAVDPITGELADFSSRGVNIDWDIKPDCVGYGVNIHSGVIGILDTLTDRRKQRYSYLSGTSMATPTVAGFLACVMEMFSEHGVKLTTSLVKDILRAYGVEKNREVGWGLPTWEMFKSYIS